MLGLDAAGKTTVLYKLKLGEVLHTIPTVGFNVESVQYKSSALTVWDVGGQEMIRPLWRYYFEHTDGLIFVVDSSDRERADGDGSARQELDRLLREPQLKNAKLLVLANKQDLPHAMGVSELTERLALSAHKDREWFVQAACATTGDGLYEGLDWLTDAVLREKKKGGL